MSAAAVATPAVAAPAVAAPARRMRLSLNENPWGPSPRVAPAIVRATAGIERYVEQAEVDALSRRIAAIERVDPAQVVIGEVLEALGLFLARQRRGGGGIVYSTPGYTALVDAAAPLGGRAVPVPLNERLENDLPALLRAIDAETLAVSLVNPHNPSGTVDDAAAFDAFVVAAAARTLVVVDEAYLEYGDFTRRSAIRHVRAGANVLVFRTLAKIYGLAGLSIGYAVAPPALAEGLRRAGIGAPHALSRPALAGAAAALVDQAHIAAVRSATLAQRARLEAAIDARGWRRTDSHANFVFFRPPDADALRRRFAAVGIDVARPFAPLGDRVRVTVGLPRETTHILSVLAAG